MDELGKEWRRKNPSGYRWCGKLLNYFRDVTLEFGFFGLEMQLNSKTSEIFQLNYLNSTTMNITAVKFIPTKFFQQVSLNSDTTERTIIIPFVSSQKGDFVSLKRRENGM